MKTNFLQGMINQLWGGGGGGNGWEVEWSAKCWSGRAGKAKSHKHAVVMEVVTFELHTPMTWPVLFLSSLDWCWRPWHVSLFLPSVQDCILQVCTSTASSPWGYLLQAQFVRMQCVFVAQHSNLECGNKTAYYCGILVPSVLQWIKFCKTFLLIFCCCQLNSRATYYFTYFGSIIVWKLQ